MIFQDLSFSLRRGEALLILGASGSGESLFLKICAGLIIPEEGKVILGRMDLALAAKETLQDLKAKVGFVFQNSALISNMAIYDIVALPLRYHKKGSEKDADKLILGLQNHWLLRGSMPRVKAEMPIAISQRESPYEEKGELNR